MLSANPRVTRILSGGVTNEREDREGQRRSRDEGLNPKEGNDSFMEMSGGERREGGTTTLATGEEERGGGQNFYRAATMSLTWPRDASMARRRRA